MAVTWEGEGSAGSSTDPTLRQVEWHVRKMAAYTDASNELINDSPTSIDALLSRLFAITVANEEDAAFLRGDGVNKPLGILNSDAAIGLTPVTNNTFALADATAMVSRFKPLVGGVWIMHRSTIPDLGAFEAGTGGSVLLADQQAPFPQGNLLGYPIVFSEHLPQANNSGHVILADLSAYAIFDLGGMLVSFSEHAAFKTDQSTWRVTKRVDGKPMLRKPVTLADPQGSYTVSPFVYFND
jgi:HK97 family phage major capsid protein